MSEVKVRGFNPLNDSGFIYSTWPKGVYYANNTPTVMAKKDFFSFFYAYMKNELEEATVSIACMSDDPQTILGYCVINRSCLTWIYVKELFRKQGIAKLLIKNKDIKSIELSNLTKIGHAILKKHPELQKKEELHEPHPSESD